MRRSPLTGRLPRGPTPDESTTRGLGPTVRRPDFRRWCQLARPGAVPLFLPTSGSSSESAPQARLHRAPRRAGSVSGTGLGGRPVDPAPRSRFGWRRWWPAVDAPKSVGLGRDRERTRRPDTGTPLVGPMVAQWQHPEGRSRGRHPGAGDSGGTRPHGAVAIPMHDAGIASSVTEPPRSSRRRSPERAFPLRRSEERRASSADAAPYRRLRGNYRYPTFASCSSRTGRLPRSAAVSGSSAQRVTFDQPREPRA